MVIRKTVHPVNRDEELRSVVRGEPRCPWLPVNAALAISIQSRQPWTSSGMVVSSPERRKARNLVLTPVLQVPRL